MLVLSMMVLLPLSWILRHANPLIEVETYCIEYKTGINFATVIKNGGKSCH